MVELGFGQSWTDRVFVFDFVFESTAAEVDAVGTPATATATATGDGIGTSTATTTAWTAQTPPRPTSAATDSIQLFLFQPHPIDIIHAAFSQIEAAFLTEDFLQNLVAVCFGGRA